MNVNAIGSQRNFIMDKRGEGVPVIITESTELSGKKPEYRLLDDSELMLTIFAYEASKWISRGKNLYSQLLNIKYYQPKTRPKISWNFHFLKIIVVNFLDSALES